MSAHRVRRRNQRRPRPFICRQCDGPCPRYAGPLGWLCHRCITDLIVKE